MDLAIVEKQGLQLSPADRALLADHLLRSLEDPAILKAWVSESADRLTAYDRGEIQARDAEAVIRDVRAGLTQ